MSTRTPHILIVEDDPEISRMLTRLLEANEMRATAVTDGRGLFRALTDGRIDLVLLDVMLPGENGFTLCGRIRAERDTPVVMLTAKAEDVDRIVGLELGADDYVTKPFNPHDLLSLFGIEEGEETSETTSASARAETTAADRLEELLAAIDTNEDGEISSDEQKNFLDALKEAEEERSSAKQAQLGYGATVQMGAEIADPWSHMSAAGWA